MNRLLFICIVVLSCRAGAGQQVMPSKLSSETPMIEFAEQGYANIPASPCCRPNKGGFFVGVDLLAVKPHLQNNPAYVVETVDNMSTASTTSVEFDFDYELSPRVWLAAQNSQGLGVRLRWWDFDHDDSINAEVTNTFPPAPAVGNVAISPDVRELRVGSTIGGVLRELTTVTATGILQIEAWDLEVYKALVSPRGWAALGFGARYAHVVQNYELRFVNVIDGNPLPNPSAGLFSNHSFSGAGPTLFLEGGHQIGSTRLHMYGGARGSILFGTGKHAAFSFDSLPGAFLDERRNSFSADDVVPVLELEGGVQWGRQTACGFLFARAGVVGQAWFDVGNTSDSEQTTLGLFGGTVSLGIQR